MHYKIKIDGKEDILVKSEYAAKSIKQQSKWMIEWINRLPKDSVVLDYGCGKLRYSIPLIKRVEEVVGVDSKEQINRKQKIETDQYLTINEYAEEKSKLSIFLIEDFNFDNYFDWAICTNVLSTIPFEYERINVLKSINNSLKKDGKALITTQYRNSYFKSYNNRKDVINYYDGWLLKNKSYYSFYGIIPPKSLMELCTKAGLKVIECKSRGENAYILIEKS